MLKIVETVRGWLRALVARECLPDPLAQLSLRDFADLPVSHPRRDESCPG